MIGLIMAVVYFVWKMFFDGDMTTEVGFLNASGFLYYWHLVFTVIFGLLLGSLSLGGTVISALIGAVGGAAAGDEVAPEEHSGKATMAGAVLGGLAGGIAGGGLSLLIFAKFMATRTLLLLGSYLMWTSGTAEMEFSDFSWLETRHRDCHALGWDLYG